MRRTINEKIACLPNGQYALTLGGKWSAYAESSRKEAERIIRQHHAMSYCIAPVSVIVTFERTSAARKKVIAAEVRAKAAAIRESEKARRAA